MPAMAEESALVRDGAGGSSQRMARPPQPGRGTELRQGGDRALSALASLLIVAEVLKPVDAEGGLVKGHAGLSGGADGRRPPGRCRGQVVGSCGQVGLQ